MISKKEVIKNAYVDGWWDGYNQARSESNAWADEEYGPEDCWRVSETHSLISEPCGNCNGYGYYRDTDIGCEVCDGIGVIL